MYADKSLAQTNCGECSLRKISLFKKCSPELLDKLFPHKEFKKFKKKEVIIHQGDSFFGVYCIQEGTVKVIKRRNKGKEFILWFAYPGDIVGLDAFISNENYSFSAVSTESVTACLIQEQDFGYLLKKEPAMTLRVMKDLSDKITFIEDRITSIARKKIREQFAELLISFAVKNKKNTIGSVQVDCTVNDMANIIGTTKNYLYKILSDFSHKNLVHRKDRKLIIKNLDKLFLVAAGV